MVAVDIKAKSRKARRKEERAKKKQKRRHHDDAEDETKRLNPIRNKPLTSRSAKEKKKVEKRRGREEDKKSVKHSDTTKLNKKTKDPYANLDPDVAAALRRDDEEIAKLEANLGIQSAKQKARLHKEYAKQECYGDDFGDFLDDLDQMCARVSSGGDDRGSDDYQALLANDQEGQLEEDSERSSEEDEEEELVRMKEPAVDNDEDESDEDEQQERSRHANQAQEDHSDSDSESESSETEEESSDENQQEPDHDIHDTYRPSKGEDIYGHKLNDDGGNAPPKKYVPPHLRKKDENNTDDTKRKESLLTIQRSLNNALNRLSEDAFVPVVQSVVQLYRSHPTSDVNACLWENMCSACLTRAHLRIGLIPVYIAALTGVHLELGESAQLGEYLLERTVVQLWKELETARNDESSNETDVVTEDQDIVNKTASNLVLVLCYLYNYGIVHCSLLYDVIRDLIESFAEIDVELLLLILSHCGRALRSDDPSALKEIVVLVKKRALQAKASNNSARVEYMVSAITDLKNNKRRKQDMVHAEKTTKLRKLLGRIKSAAAASKGGFRSSDSSLRISLDDILNAETKGRWWKVGASWVGNQYRFQGDETGEDDRAASTRPAASTQPTQEDAKLLKLAAKYRMNTDIRRSIFCIIMGSADYEDAFEKLVRGGMLKNRTERETARVLMECCGNEKAYNKFYSHLASRICDYQSQCKFTFQLAYWDTFKVFEDLKIRKAANLAKLLFHLVAIHRSLKLNVLKAIDMSSPEELPETAIIFLTIFLSSILEHFEDPSDVTQLFESGISHRKASSSEKLDTIGNDDDDLDHIDDGEALRASLSVFFIQIMKASPRYKKGSRYRANLKAAIKVCDTDNFF